MIDKPHQVSLMLGAARDYQEGLMSLQTLIWKIEGLLNVIEDEALATSFPMPCSISSMLMHKRA
jgi:hypothetical protein